MRQLNKEFEHLQYITRKLDEEDKVEGKFVSELEVEVNQALSCVLEVVVPFELKPQQARARRYELLKILTGFNEDESVLEQIKSTIAKEAVERSIVCHNEIEHAQKCIEGLLTEMSNLTEEKSMLLMKRYGTHSLVDGSANAMV